MNHSFPRLFPDLLEIPWLLFFFSKFPDYSLTRKSCPIFPCFSVPLGTLSVFLNLTHLCIVGNVQPNILTVTDITELYMRLSARTGHTHRCSNWNTNHNTLTVCKLMKNKEASSRKTDLTLFYRIEFDKTSWYCPWNSDQNCIQNSARGWWGKGGCWLGLVSASGGAGVGVTLGVPVFCTLWEK